jgi:Protein of unknown function (DUF2971)
MNKFLHSTIQEALKATRREALHAAAVKLRFAWAEGHSTLYKFMGLRGERLGYVVDVLENSRIYFSSPDQLNDPADCRPVFKMAKPLTDLEFIKELEDGEKKMIAEEKLTPEQVAEARIKHGVRVEDLARSITEHTQLMLQTATRIFCLSTRHQSAQMWGYYADAHCGVCLHFNCDSGSLLGMARRVVYSEVREPILVPIQYNNDDDVADRMVFAKAQDWHHEEEYRIVAHENMVGDEFPLIEGCYAQFPAHLLTGITFGSQITDANRRELLTIIARRGVPMSVLQATLGDGFAIEVQPFT